MCDNCQEHEAERLHRERVNQSNVEVFTNPTEVAKRVKELRRLGFNPNADMMERWAQMYQNSTKEE